jgi:hypothetical protein
MSPTGRAIMRLERRMREEMRRMAADLEPDIEERLEATLRGARRADTRRQLRDALASATVVLVVLLVGVPFIGALRDRSLGVGATRSPTVPLPLAGTYATTLVSTDVAVTSNRMSGDWTIRFGSDRILTVTVPTGFTGTFSGYSFEVVGSQFRTDLFGEDLCSTLLPGSYQWSLSSDRLTFAVVDDSCSGRVALLTTGAWYPAVTR